MLLVWRKYIDNAVDRTGCTDRMQGREDQMSCLSGGHSNLHSLVITHFPEEYNIRALAQGSTKSRYITFCIYVNLTLAEILWSIETLPVKRGLTPWRICDKTRIIKKYMRYLKTLTKTVGYIPTIQRTGDGGNPVQVRYNWRSLPSFRVWTICDMSQGICTGIRNRIQ